MKDCLLHCQSSEGSSCGGDEFLEDFSGPVQFEPHLPSAQKRAAASSFSEHINSTKHLYYICRIQSKGEFRSLVLAASVLDYMVWIH